MMNDIFILNNFGAAVLDAEKHAQKLISRYDIYKTNLTKEEKAKVITENRKKRLIDIFEYLLKNYEWQFAYKFYLCRKEQFEKYNVLIDFNIPHCYYDKNNQCDLSCSFFNGKCTYKEEK